MNIEEYREHCIAKAGVTEGFPFDNKTLVFKVYGKMFALTNVDTFESINLKCDPEKAEELRAKYEQTVLPGWHMNKQHWNTIKVDGELSDDELKYWIDHSYELIVASIPKSKRS